MQPGHDQESDQRDLASGASERRAGDRPDRFMSWSILVRQVRGGQGAARWARILGYPEALFVKLAMQAELDAAGIKLKIDVKAA